MAQISAAKGTKVVTMDVDPAYVGGLYEGNLGRFSGLVLNVNKGTQSLKAEAFPSVHPSVPKGIAISTGRGTGIRYL